MNIALVAALIFSTENSLEIDETFLMPKPTNQINQLINQLGHDSCKIRDNAETELNKLGWNALKACQQAKNNNDPEIRERAEKIYENYFNITNNHTPSIWYLSHEYRYPAGIKFVVIATPYLTACEFLPQTDIAVKFYQKATDNIEMNSWHDKKTRQKATQLYLRYLLSINTDRNKVKNILNEMNQNKENFLHYIQISTNPQNNPPGPMIEKEKYKWAGGL